MEEKISMFDGYTETNEKQRLDFRMITDAFAVYEYNEEIGWHFVMDANDYTYIICMDIQDMENYQEQYEYTYYAEEGTIAPAPVSVEGYSVEIDENLKELAIESFNEIFGGDYVDEENFEEYVGTCYLDTTLDAAPGESGSISSAVIETIGAAAVIIILGLYGVYRHKKQKNAEAEADAGMDAAETDNVYEQTRMSYEECCEEEEAFRPVPAVIGAVFGAALGGVLWILLHRIGFIAGISGYAAVFGAAWGYEKLGKRKAEKSGMVFCLIIGILMIIGANYVAYAWEISSAMNENASGSANFVTVLTHMPQLLREYELVKAFFLELLLGAICSAYAVWVGWMKRRVAAKKKIK